jgi:hypothetical protein
MTTSSASRFELLFGRLRFIGTCDKGPVSFTCVKAIMNEERLAEPQMLVDFPPKFLPWPLREQ